jgi:hypothetical protein
MSPLPCATHSEASRLWGLRGEAGEQVGGHFVLTYLERAAVGVAAGPAGVVASGDGP